MTDHQHHHQQSAACTAPLLTPPPTPPAVRHVLSLSSSMSPPHTPNRQRQMGWWQSSVVRRSSSAVDEAVDELTEKSRFLLEKSRSNSNLMVGTPKRREPLLDSPLEGDDDDKEEEETGVTITTTPTFHREEILAGELLGEGTFSSVYEVVGFALSQDHPLRSASNSPTRFALKHLKPSLLQNTLQFEQAATDLVMEAKYLAALDHPNILKLHGEPRNGTAAINSGVDGYFLLTDRLSETLAQRIERWRDGQDASVASKLSYALQIGHALKYLHEQRIIFRDLKPSNIGFHQVDSERIQLFDFGLCRELPPAREARPYVVASQEGQEEQGMDRSEYSQDLDDDDDREGVFLMSGAGTQIYMAPEILLQNRYNLKSDVYSYAMTVTELLLLDKPLPLYEMDEHIQYVCVEGDRPALEGHPEIPDSLRDLLAWAWEGNVSKRCSIAQVCEELPEIVAEIEEQQAAVAVTATSNWPSKMWQAVRRIPQYLMSVMGRALERVSFFFSARCNTGNSRDVTFDLPQEKKREEPDPSQTEASSNTSNNNDDAVNLSPRPAPPRFSRSALFKRKPSSASTTAMTDDELDDDYYDLALPFSPLSKPCPMEVLVERNNTTAT